MVSSSCSTSGTRHVNLVTNLVISHEWGENQEVFTTSGTYPWSFVTQIFRNCQPSHGGDHKTFEVITSTWQSGTLGSVASFVRSNPLSKKSWLEPQALEYRINWEICTPYAGAAGMLLHMNGKFTMGKLKSSLLL
jgi:hypothetical protein